MDKLNNFEMHNQATYLSSSMTGYKLARLFLNTQQELEELEEKYANLNQMFDDYLSTHKVIQAELERLQMQEQICPNKVLIQYELECG